jgi:hypothetical protein
LCEKGEEDILEAGWLFILNFLGKWRRMGLMDAGEERGCEGQRFEF